MKTKTESVGERIAQKLGKAGIVESVEEEKAAAALIDSELQKDSGYADNTDAVHSSSPEQTGDALRLELLKRGLDVRKCTAETEQKVINYLRDYPLPCPFPSCVSRFRDEGEPSSVRVEEMGGGFVAECEECCGGTGSFHTKGAALDEWNKLAKAVLGSGILAPQTKETK